MLSLYTDTSRFVIDVNLKLDRIKSSLPALFCRDEVYLSTFGGPRDLILQF